MSKRENIMSSFTFAGEGMKQAFRSEPNIRIHAVIGLFAFLAGLFFGLSGPEMAILILTIFFVIILELINTSIEAVVNLVSPEIKSQAKIAKDVSAAAVMLTSLLAIVIGFFLFAPKVLNLIQF